MADMILPKGIVFNRNDIYEEIAKYDIVPLEQILAACHVFTTTSRELVDPTARRLENFWTRVLGGDRRYLPGTVIARLFKSISEEESFVKLRGPPNRYEPPSPDSKAESPTRVQVGPDPSGEGPSEPKGKGKGKAKTTKAASSSSTKQPHPILKKPRGPSSSGPRPTARFVSPPGSDGEGDDGKDGELASSGSTAVNHSGDSRGSNSSTAKEEKRKATNTTPKKKATAFVASTASRRRPAMPRRISSQSSTAVGGTEVGPKEGNSSLGSRQSGSQSSVPTIPEKPGKGLPSTTKDDEKLSAKAAGKRPATRLSSDKPPAPSTSGSQTSVTRNQPLMDPDEPSNVKQPDSTADTVNKATMDDANRTKAGRSGTIHRRSDTQERPRPDVAPLMTRSRSDVGSSRRSSQDLTRVRAPPHSLISPSTTTISNTTAQGTIIEFDENPPINEAIASALQEQEEEAETSSRRSVSSVLDSRFTPTQPSTTPTVPLGRSKSQLTLLLERQGEKKPRR
ncbi:hypothetical protein F4677DRAFT_358407 [Hypoxylon crocopeplum]|nr:hypothetical protein F4677DRAFT_358407 [Hypoxylon crocopeplum]